MGKIKGISMVIQSLFLRYFPPGGKPIVPPPPPVGGCHHYVVRKNRYCKMIVKAGARYI